MAWIGLTNGMSLKHLTGLMVCIFLALPVAAQIPIGGGGLPGGGGGLPGGRGVQGQNPFSDTTSQDRKKGEKFLDDSTKQVYGAYSTQYWTQNDFFVMMPFRRQVDTLIRHFHRYNFVQRTGNRLQDLGTVGTASKSLYPQRPQRVGTRLGIAAFAPYTFDFGKLRYYNTRSPFSEWQYAQGGGGRSVLDVTFAQNINPDWNVRLTYRSITAKLLTGTSVESNNDQQARYRGAIFNTVFERGRYKLLTAVDIYEHLLIETGGLMTDSVDRLSEMYDFEDQEWQNRLVGTNGTQSARRLHAYQQFAIDSARLHVFHELTFMDRTARYEDKNLANNAGFYDEIRLDDSNTEAQILYREVQNRAGVKARLGRFFWSGWIKHRLYRFRNDFQGNRMPLAFPDEVFVGGRTSFALRQRDSARVEIEAEYLLPSEYRLLGRVHLGWAEAGYLSASYQPGVVQRFAFNNHFAWDQDFSNILHNEVYGQLNLSLGKQRFTPSIRAVNLSNWVYYNTEAIPTRANQAENLLLIGLDMEIVHGKVHHLVDMTYAQNGENSTIRMPRLLVNYQIYHFWNINQGKMLLQVGLDFHWRSQFYADTYSPVLQQFHLQDRYQIGNYLFVEPFVNFLVNRVRMFFKVPNAAQGLLGKGGYATPGYMWQPRQFEFGINWQLFD